jgi:hypothetical protein
VSGFDIHGYAIISRDDRIADAQGAMPEALKNDADWAYFQAELDRADWVLLGRASHEATPNTRRRRRIVLSHAARGLERRPEAVWWNPQAIAWRDAMARLAPDGARVAVPGGQGAFDLFLRIGFGAFHLSRAKRVALPDGRFVFSVCEREGVTAETALLRAGLVAGATRDIDALAGVTLTVWRSDASER